MIIMRKHEKSCQQEQIRRVFILYAGLFSITLNITRDEMKGINNMSCQE